MTKNKLTLLGSAFAGLIGAALLGGTATAQDYYSPSVGSVAYEEPYYDRGETVIVRPFRGPYNRIERHQLLGRVNGEINPVVLSMSRPVSYSDLDLSRATDYDILRGRILATAHDVCVALAQHDVGLVDSDRQATRDCIRSAARNAMDEIPAG